MKKRKEEKKNGCIYKDALKKFKADADADKALLIVSSIDASADDDRMISYLDASNDDADKIFNQMDAADALFTSIIISSINDKNDDASNDKKADKRHLRKGRMGRRMKQMLNDKADNKKADNVSNDNDAALDNIINADDAEWASYNKRMKQYYSKRNIVSYNEIYLDDDDASNDINYNFKQMNEWIQKLINNNDKKDAEIDALKKQIDALKADKADADADKAEIINVINYNADIINSYKAEIDALKNEISALKISSINKADNAEIIKNDNNYQLSINYFKQMIMMIYYFISGCIINTINYIIISPIRYIINSIISIYNGCINYLNKIRMKYYNYKIMKYNNKISSYKNKIIKIEG